MERDLTDLESCVLGVVWRSDPPITAYEIAATFARSQSPYWSGSAGTIYPLVKRLRENGFIRSKSEPWKRSRRTIFTITPKGKARLRAWLKPPLPSAAGAPSFDPVRTRLFFIEVLPPRERLAFLDAAEAVIREQIDVAKRQRAEDAARGESFEALGYLGVVYELEARLRWLRHVRRLIKR